MKVGNYTVKYTYKPARIISDVISLGMAAFAIISAVSFTEKHPEIQLDMAKMDLITLWIFPAICIITVIICVLLTLRSPRYEKYSITKDNAQSVFDWYLFELSLCKLPVLLSAVEAEFIVQTRLLGFDINFFSITFVLCALIFVIIIRFSAHRISSLTKTNNKKGGMVYIKSDIADKKPNNDEREKK